MASVVLKEEDNVIITENLIINQFIKMGYWEFEKWIINKISYDYKYVSDNKNLYAIRICFSKKMIESLSIKYNKKDIIKYIKPIYPWKKDIIDKLNIENNNFENEIQKIIKKIEKNENKEEILEDLKNMIKGKPTL